MKEETQDNEFSLIDLFVILLKRWKLIAAVTLCGILLSLVWFFLSPQSGFKSGILVEGRMTVMLNPAAAAFMPVDLTLVFNWPELVLLAFGDMGLKTLELDGSAVSIDGKTERSVILLFIENKMIQGGKNFSVSASRRLGQTSNAIDIMFRYGDPDIIKGFLEALSKRGNAVAGEIMKPFMETFIADYEAFMSPDSPSLNKSLSLNEVSRYNFSKAVLADRERIIIELFPPSITEDAGTVLPSGGGGKFLVVVLAAFFFSVFLTFCLNAVDNLKKDGETLNKIRGALGKKDDYL
ncbi:MAG: hypothetical protein LBI86_01345 [Treponema sp.]|jgi:hypothetical protein|nr:hypothetical protein [Treponema sp.]